MRISPGAGVSLLLLAAVTVLGCRDKAAERRSTSERKAPDAKEIQDYLDAAKTRDAPLIAARNDLPVEVVKRILLFVDDQQPRELDPKTLRNPKWRLTDIVPNMDLALDKIAASEKLDRRTIANVLFDAALLHCGDRDSD